MQNERTRMLVTLGVCAGVAAVLWALACGSHLGFSLSSNSSSYDFRVGMESNAVSNLLGIAAVVLFIMGAGLDSRDASGASPGAGPGSPYQGLAAFGATLRRLAKSRRDVWLGGVCGGLGEVTPIPSWAWRVAFLGSLCLYGTGVMVYIVLWVCLPESRDEPGGPSTRTM